MRRQRFVSLPSLRSKFRLTLRATSPSVRFAFALFAVALASIGGAPAAQAASKLHVIATVGDLGAIARDVLGSAGDVVVLAKPTQDPHFVDARPNLILDLNRADALVSMGLDYEVGWLPVLVKGSRNGKIQNGSAGSIVASTMVPLREVPQQRIDRAMGDIHPGGNPHFTLDPRNGARIARGLAERFGNLSPENRALYTQNADAFVKKLDAKTKEWEQRMAARRGTAVVSYHKSLTYLNRLARPGRGRHDRAQARHSAQRRARRRAHQRDEDAQGRGASCRSAGTRRASPSRSRARPAPSWC